MMGDVSQNSFLLSPTHSIIESVNQNQLVNRQNLCTSDCSLLTRTSTSVLVDNVRGSAHTDQTPPQEVHIGQTALPSWPSDPPDRMVPEVTVAEPQAMKPAAHFAGKERWPDVWLDTDSWAAARDLAG